MTKVAKIIIGVAMLLIVALLITGTQMLSKTTDNQLVKLGDYYTRKEELLMQEQKLEALIQQLNNTLEQEKTKQNNLVSQLSYSEQEVALVEKIAASAPPTPAPAPKPIVRTTSAS